MLLWMLTAMLFALVVGVAAHGVATASSLLRRQSRGAWTLALLTAICWPILARVVVEPTPVSLAPRLVNGDVADAFFELTSRAPLLQVGAVGLTDTVLAALWLIASSILLFRLVRAQRALSTLAHRAPATHIDGHAVIVTDRLGPAAFGLFPVRIALPIWITELDASLRSLIVRHEQAHCDARDTALLWLGELAKVVMPWNVAVWWMTTKLRLAIELDCDLRTLRALRTPAEEMRYARLLLLIAQHQQETPRAPMLAAFDSHLSKRITSMNRSAAAITSPRVLAPLVMAIVASLAACSPDATKVMSATGKVMSATGSPAALAPDGVFFDFQVATPAAVLPASTAPQYPAALRAAKVEGEVLVQFVIDTAGAVELGSFKVLRHEDVRFADAIKVAVPGFRFSPARLEDGRKVRQLVQQPFAFALAR